jgi:ADP-ribosylglycohydrolase
VESVVSGETTGDYAALIGLEHGVGGYIYHTVPVVLHAWLSHPIDLPAALSAVIRCGGDTDTTAAILGGIVGARVGVEGIPAAWRTGLCEWPRNPAWIKGLSARLATAITQQQPQPPVSLPFLAVLSRNLLFLAVVLAHGFRRLLPPY